MTFAHKLRVATPRWVGALPLVRAEVAATVGADPGTELQELDHHHVVVELSLPPLRDLPATPSEMAQVVGRAASTFEVLGAWDEAYEPPRPAPRPPEAVLRMPEAARSPVALRALLDDAPTSVWQPSAGCWELGVPVTTPAGHRAVACLHRRGYSQRFTAHEVAATRESLVRLP